MANMILTVRFTSQTISEQSLLQLMKDSNIKLVDGPYSVGWHSHFFISSRKALLTKQILEDNQAERIEFKISHFYSRIKRFSYNEKT